MTKTSLFIPNTGLSTCAGCAPRQGRCEHSRRRTRGAAFSLLETTIGIFILSCCFVAFAQLRSMTIGERLRLNTVEQARTQLQNVLELLGDVPQKEFIACTFPRKEVDALVAHSFPDGQLKFEVIQIVFRPEEKQLVDDSKTSNMTPMKEPPKAPNKDTANEHAVNEHTANKDTVNKDTAKKDAVPNAKNVLKPEVSISALRATLSWYDGQNKPRKSVTLTKILPDSKQEQ
ncbi:MAG: hypothetical protein PHQ75_01855 [Thermoguttaceae bacterium]|nr:hypothetical protein [Thermoguttaceae bacterium]